MNNNDNSKFIVALGFVGIMFFVLGFALGINSLLIPVLKQSFEISSGASYLTLTATFLAYLIFGYPAAKTIQAIGYRRTMSLSFLFYAIGFAVCIMSIHYNSFGLFLAALLVVGTGSAFLQAAVNPYTTILGPMESAARRISMMGICNKLATAIAPVFLAWVISKDVKEIVIGDMYTPFYIIIGIFLVLGIAALLAPLPEVKAAGEESVEDCPYAMNKTSVWQFPHLWLGAIALFLYVGIETVALTSIVDYAKELGLSGEANYGWVSSIGMVVGYVCGIALIPKYISQGTALRVCAWLGIVSVFLVTLTPPEMSIWFLGIMALGCSLMWPAIWPLAMTDLGRFTKTGSSLLVMAIAGGAVTPTLFGFLKDAIGQQGAYWIGLPCFLFILYYAVRGYKIRTK